MKLQVRKLSKTSKSVLLVIAIIGIGIIALPFIKRNRARRLLEEYRFLEAMKYYDENIVYKEEDELKNMYMQSNYSQKIYRYILDKGYEQEEFYYKVSSDIEPMWEDYMVSNLEKYENMDFRLLRLCEKLNIIARLDDDEMVGKLEESLRVNLREAGTYRKDDREEVLEEFDYKFLLDEMREKGIKSYFKTYLGAYDEFTYLFIGSREDKSYIYTVDKDYKTKLFKEIDGVKKTFGFTYLKSFLLPETTIISEVYIDGIKGLVGFILVDDQLEILEWDLVDDIKVDMGKISSKKLNKTIDIKEGRIEETMDIKEDRLFKIYKLYNTKDRLENIVIGEYKMLSSGELEFTDLYLGL